MNCQIAMTMQATGISLDKGPVEVCGGCHKPFPRGAQMNAVEYADGTPLGWICDGCVYQWRHTGNPPAGLLEGVG